MIPRHLEVAFGELGVEEWPGQQHNPRILEYHAVTTLGDWGRSRDETPWCSSFCCWVHEQVGRSHTHNALARSWLRWGYRRRPWFGDIVVLQLSRATRRARQRTGSARGGYHVGWFIDWTRGGLILLSGNVDDRVGVDFYSLQRWDVRGVRAVV